MAKSKTLDDFLQLWGEYEDVKEDISAYSQDPSNPKIYNKVIARQADMLGTTPKALQTHPITKERIQYTPVQIRSFLEGENGKGGQKAYTRDTAHQYADKDLESVVKAIPEDKIAEMLGFNIPKETGNKTHDEAAKLHGDYISLLNAVMDYKSEKKDAFPALLKTSKAAAIDLLKEKYGKAEVENELEEMKKGKKGKTTPLRHVIYSAMYTVMTNPGTAVNIITETAGRKYKTLTESLKGKTVEYVADNLRNSKPGEKENFYGGMYQTLAKQDERNELRMAA